MHPNAPPRPTQQLTKELTEFWQTYDDVGSLSLLGNLTLQAVRKYIKIPKIKRQNCIAYII